MNVQAAARLALERDLRRALEGDAFLLHYQPMVDLATGKIAGAEALVRWRHPELGIVPPSEFIPVLEETGLIVPLGQKVLRAACRQNRAWRDAGLPPARVAVNISARQFGEENFASVVKGALRDSGLDHGSLELEISESLLVEGGEVSLWALDQFRKAVGHVRVAIDDFGTGNCSLRRLKALPMNALKIHRTCITGIPAAREDVAITAALIDLSHNLGIRVTAEGVETAEQAAFLRDQGCDEAQGYYFGRPMPAGEFGRLLETYSPLADVLPGGGRATESKG
jgi:EAL domain-containing protein (putative c-di-GMP-specific phosphodiesterase class I)